jgi:hypothetical protein
VVSFVTALYTLLLVCMCVQVLEKTFYLEDPIEIVPEKFVGTSIEWAPGKDTTVKTVRKKMKDKKLKGQAPAVTVTDTVPCDSFFNFFG